MGGREIKAGKAYIEFEARFGQLVAGLREVQGKLKEFSSRLAQTVRSLKFQFRAALQTARNMLLGFAGAVTSTALAVSSWGDAQVKLARRLGLTVQQLQRFQYVVRSTGGSINDSITFLRILNRRLGEAQQGLGEARRGLDALGLSAEELAGLDPVSAFLRIHEELTKINSRQKQMAILFRFGDTAAFALMNTLRMSRKELEEMMRQADQLGQVISPGAAIRAEVVAQNFDELVTALKNLAVEIGSKLVPVLQSLTKYTTALTKWLPQFLRTQRGQAVAEIAGFGLAMGVGRKVLRPFSGLLKVLAPLGRFLLKTISWAFAAGLRGIGFRLVGFLLGPIGIAATTVLALISSQVRKVLVSVGRFIWNTLKTVFSNLPQLLWKGFKWLVTELPRLLMKAFTGLFDWIGGVIHDITSEAPTQDQLIAQGRFEDLDHWIKKTAESLQQLEAASLQAATTFREKFADRLEKSLDPLTDLVAMLDQVVSSRRAVTPALAAETEKRLLRAAAALEQAGLDRQAALLRSIRLLGPGGLQFDPQRLRQQLGQVLAQVQSTQARTLQRQAAARAATAFRNEVIKLLSSLPAKVGPENAAQIRHLFQVMERSGVVRANLAGSGLLQRLAQPLGAAERTRVELQALQALLRRARSGTLATPNQVLQQATSGVEARIAQVVGQASAASQREAQLAERERLIDEYRRQAEQRQRQREQALQAGQQELRRLRAELDRRAMEELRRHDPEAAARLEIERRQESELKKLVELFQLGIISQEEFQRLDYQVRQQHQNELVRKLEEIRQQQAGQAGQPGRRPIGQIKALRVQLGQFWQMIARQMGINVQQLMDRKLPAFFLRQVRPGLNVRISAPTAAADMIARAMLGFGFKRDRAGRFIRERGRLVLERQPDALLANLDNAGFRAMERRGVLNLVDRFMQRHAVVAAGGAAVLAGRMGQPAAEHPLARIVGLLQNLVRDVQRGALKVGDIERILRPIFEELMRFQ